MPVTLSTFEPNPDGTCRICRGALNQESWLCERCGAAHGERNRCPHCQSIARTLPHRSLLRVCSVCGRPRFSPMLGPISPNDNATHRLRSAGHSHRIGQVLTYVSYALLSLGGLGLLLTATILLILMPGAWVSGIALTLFAVLPLLLGFIARSRAQSERKSSERMLDQAYEDGILALLRSSGAELDSVAIAHRSGLFLDRVEQLLAKLNVDDRMTSRVTDEGSIVYGLPDVLPAPHRLRVPMAGVTNAELVDDSNTAEPSEATNDPSRRHT